LFCCIGRDKEKNKEEVENQILNSNSHTTVAESPVLNETTNKVKSKSKKKQSAAAAASPAATEIKPKKENNKSNATNKDSSDEVDNASVLFCCIGRDKEKNKEEVENQILNNNSHTTVAESPVLNEITNKVKSKSKKKQSAAAAASPAATEIKPEKEINKSNATNKDSSDEVDNASVLFCCIGRDREKNKENNEINALSTKFEGQKINDETTYVIKKSQSSYANNATKVISVKKLNPKLAKLDHLCIVFGLYGHVVRMKLDTKKQNCFIELNTVEQAENCIKYLNNFFLWDETIEVGFSVQEIKNEEPNYTVKEYINSPFNRELLTSEKPSCRLFVSSNVALNKEELDYMFGKYIEYQNIGDYQYLITMSSIESATLALIFVHGMKLPGNQLPIVCNFYNH
jgi:predicted nucleic acid-binding protein